KVVGKTKTFNKNNHVSIPIPVIIEVIKAKYSGRLFSAMLLKINIETPTTISYVSTVKLNDRFNPTNKESYGEVHKRDKIIKTIYYGRLLSAMLLKINIETPTTISHIPTVKPVIRINPTNKESYGEVPKREKIVKAIPNVKMIKPIIEK